VHQGEYLRDPAAIYQASFAAIRREAAIDRLPQAMQPVALRLIHACGMPEILPDLIWTGNAVSAGRRALAAGRPVLVDSTMVAAGIRRERLPAGNAVVCRIN
jgi:precorrin-8X/cobalt-precorrin-8 methylmutase